MHRVMRALKHAQEHVSTETRVLLYKPRGRRNIRAQNHAFAEACVHRTISGLKHARLQRAHAELYADFELLSWNYACIEACVCGGVCT